VNYGDETLSIIDMKTRNTIATLPVGHHPQSLAVDPQNNRIYVTNVRSDSVTIIDGAKNAVIGAQSAGKNPYGVAVDPASGRVYAANYAAPWLTRVATVK
jgi:YVTN family beta-propeller protein